ncbi:MAG: ATP-dependent helicase, partial [Chloroflexi bacterium]
MAYMIPRTPIVNATPEQVRLFNVLKRLPEEIYVSQRIPQQDGVGPDFWVLYKNRLIVLAVCAATGKDVKQANQLGLFKQSTDAKRIGHDAHEAIAVFREQVTAVIPHSPCIPAGVIFPNLTAKQLAQVSSRPADMLHVSKENLTPTFFGEWVVAQLSTPYAADVLDAVRQVFTPEVVVPSQFTVRKPVDRGTQATLQPYLLDYSQERALKSALNLSDEGQNVVRDFHLRLINGVAGSGKSLIVIYRAHMLRNMFPGKRILVLTHNRALINDLRQRYDLLSDGDKKTKFYTFNQWCRRYWPKSEDELFRDFVSHKERLHLVEQVWMEDLAKTAVSPHLLMDEIDWYKDRMLFSREDYLDVNRTGRGFALNESMRHRVFDGMQAYHKKLQARNKMDWGDVPRHIWRFIESGTLRLPQYDIILVDEAQFFAPIWFEIIKKLLAPQVGQLFLVADSSQGFLKRGQSWLASGLDVRGRVHRLHKSYRTTKEIMSFATLLYRTRLPEDDEDIVTPRLDDMPTGVFPLLLSLTSEQDEVTRVVNEIEQLLQAGMPKGHILIIHADPLKIDMLGSRLAQKFGAETAVDPRYEPDQDKIRVCPLNAATGLESPIVFLMGVHSLYEREQSIRLSEEERYELIRDNTRKLHMAITRAG